MITVSFSPFPVLTTERLLLRQLSTTDTQEIFLLRSDDNVNEFLDRKKAVSLDDARDFIDRINNGVQKDESILWAIVPKNENKLVGTICIWNLAREEDKAEIGYELLPGSQGKGYMQEAIAHVIGFGLQTMKLKKIEACLRSDNVRSLKLLEANKFLRDIEAEMTMDPHDKAMNMVIYSLRV